jgi:tRNA-binding protein
MGTIGFDEWKKLQLRVGKVLEVQRIPKTDKLYRLKVDIGAKDPVQIVTSLVPYYAEDELQDQSIVVLVNLQPAQFAGERSEGMLLCAEREDGSECVLLTVQKDIPPGTPIT